VTTPATFHEAGDLDLYRSVFELNPQAMWICDSRISRFLLVNEAAIDQYGYSRNEFQSMKVNAVFSAESVDDFFSYGQRIRDSPAGTVSRAWRHRTKCGETFDADMKISPIRFDGREAMLVIVEDVTARVRDEKLLATRGALARLIDEESPDALSRILRCLCEFLAADAAELWTLEEDGQFLRNRVAWCKPGVKALFPACAANAGSLDWTVAVESRGSVLFQAAASSEPRWIPEIATEPGYRERAAALEFAGIRAGVAFGVSGADIRTRGAVVAMGENQHPPDLQATQLLMEVGRQLGHCLERRRIQEELRAREETVRSFLDEAPFSYHETDKNGVVVRVNRAECELLGLDESEIVGRPVWDFVTEAEREDSRKTILLRIQQRGATIAPFQRRRRTPKGESTFRVHARRITNAAGEVTGIRSAMFDLTEANLSRQRIEFQTSLLDQINDAVLTVDRDFRIQYFNAAAEQLFGWSAQEAAGQMYLSVAGTIVTPAEREAIHANIFTRGAWNGEIICSKRTGERFLVHVSWSVLHDLDGNPTAVVGIHTDLTAPKQMEQALRESEDRSRLAHSALALGTWEADLSADTVRCSEQLLRLYGIFEPRGVMSFREWQNSIHPGDKSKRFEGAKELFQGSESFERQLRVIWPDGSVHWLHSKSRLIFGEPGQPPRVIGVDFDITEHKLIEERLRIQHEELANSSRVTELEKHLLELVARGTPLQQLLDNVTSSIEAMEPECVCTILLLDEEHRRFLLNGSGPSLPPEYMQALSGLEIGPEVGACGSAAFLNQTVIVEDIATDYRFGAARDFVTSFGLRSCWSVPIRNFNDVVLGTFAMYHRKPAKPLPAELRLVEAGARIAGNVIEWLRSQQQLRETSERLALAEKASEFGIWEVNVSTGAIAVSEGFKRLLGLPPDARRISLSELDAMLHPEDRAAVRTAAQEAIETGSFQAEFRVVLPDGSIRWARSQGRVEPVEGGATRATGALIDITEQKRTEQRLHILSSAVEQCPISILISNLNDEIEYVNGRLTESTGYTLEELKGQHPRKLSGAMPPEHFEEIARALPMGQWQGVVRSRKKSGELFWESVFVRAIRDAQGKPTHMIAVAEDITERLEMESALKLSEERFRIAAQSSGDSIYEWDLHSDRVTVLGAYQPGAEVFAVYAPWRAREFRRRFYHPDDRERVEAAIQRHLEHGEPFEQEFRIVLPSGEARYYVDQGSAVRDATGRPYKWIGASRDITDQKKVERANAQLASIVENADTAIISEDLSGAVLTWNRGAERIYGYSADEMVGQTMAPLVPADRYAEETAFVKKLRSGEGIKHVETMRLTKSGEPIPVLLTLSPMQDRQGNFLGIAHVAEDITHVKELERQLAQTQKIESIGQLAAGIAHEINTPIQYIGDNGRFLEDAFRDLVKFVEAGRDWGSSGGGETVVPTREKLEEGVYEYLRDEIPKAIEQLLSGVDQVARIVLAMKEFSHPGMVEKMPVDINRAIESTVLVSRSEWKYMAELTTDFDRNLPPVPCVAGEFNQVILNLIVNAAHAIADVVKDSGGMGRIHIATRRDGPAVEIRVSDTGCGIPKANQSKVFDPFFTTKPMGKGTGQGLAIAYGVIVQRHEGVIQLESEPGSGTTFIIRLPLALELEAA
jgi:PAS domain S-box-containing protein